MSLSHFSSKVSITPILLETLEPPIMATRGRLGASIAFCKNSNSFSINKPATEVERW